MSNYMDMSGSLSKCHSGLDVFRKNGSYDKIVKSHLK